MSSVDIFSCYASVLKEFREKVNLSQAELALKVGKPESWVVSLEAGEREAFRSLDVDLMMKFWDVFGVSGWDFSVRAHWLELCGLTRSDIIPRVLVRTYLCGYGAGVLHCIRNAVSDGSRFDGNDNWDLADSVAKTVSDDAVGRVVSDLSYLDSMLEAIHDVLFDSYGKNSPETGPETNADTSSNGLTTTESDDDLWSEDSEDIEDEIYEDCDEDVSDLFDDLP